jgi:AcrR family transcriptional regulator
MRALAEEAGVSVVTAYNHFGSKAGVMRGIIRRLIDEIRRRYFAAPIAKSVIDRILAMAEMGAQVSLDESQLYRTVGRSLMVFDEQMTLEGVRPEKKHGLMIDAGPYDRGVRSRQLLRLQTMATLP